MKVAVTSQGSDLDSQVDPRFGRAVQFIVVNTDTGEFTAHDNSQNLNATHGAGIQSGQNVVAFGVEAIITGNVGPKAEDALKAGGVKIYTGATGTIKDALEQFKNNELKLIE